METNYALADLDDLDDKEFDNLLDVLNERERNILFSRCGLDGGKPKTLQNVGAKFGISRERVRQIINNSLGKLRRELRMRRYLKEIEELGDHARCCTPYYRGRPII